MAPRLQRESTAVHSLRGIWGLTFISCVGYAHSAFWCAERQSNKRWAGDQGLGLGACLGFVIFRIGVEIHGAGLRVEAKRA